MKSPITGSARSVSDFGERTRSLFKDRPLNAPAPLQNRFSKSRRPPPPAREEAEPAPAVAESESGDEANATEHPDEE